MPDPTGLREPLTGLRKPRERWQGGARALCCSARASAGFSRPDEPHLRAKISVKLPDINGLTPNSAQKSDGNREQLTLPEVALSSDYMLEKVIRLREVMLDTAVYQLWVDSRIRQDRTSRAAHTFS